MARNLKIRKIGNSCGVILPKELLRALGVGEGDELYPVRMPNGIHLAPFDPEFAAVLEDSRDYMRRHRNALRDLAER